MNRAMAILLLIGAAGIGSAGETNPPPLRIWSLSPDAFDYVFMSAVRQASGDALLSFNHRGGRTAFRKAGQKLDDWLIVSHDPARREESGADGIVRTVDAGRVLLRADDGATRTLDQGKTFPIEGFRATLRDISGGAWFSVRTGDTIALGADSLRVNAVQPGSVIVTRDGRDFTLSIITEAEAVAVHDLLEEQGRERERIAARRREELERAEAEAWAQHVKFVPPKPEPPIETFPARPSFVTGVYGPLPVEYTVIPAVFDAKGRMVRGPLVVPTRFETYPIGTSGIVPGHNGTIGVQRRTVIPTFKVSPP